MSLMRPQPYKGYESVTTRFSMAFNMYLSTLLSLLGLHVLIVGIIAWHWVDLSPFRQWFNLTLAAIWALYPDSSIALNLGTGKGLQSYPALQIRDVLIEYIEPSLSRIGFFALWTSPIYVLAPVLFRYFKHVSEEESGIRHVRGFQQITAKALNRELRRLKEKRYLPIGNIAIPFSFETLHGLILGATGSGKTTIFLQVYDFLSTQEAKGLVFDSKGDFIARRYDPSRDILFNPLDARCVGWNIFNEIHNTLDIEKIGSSLFPETHKERDAYWRMAARDIFIGLLHYLWQKNKRTNRAVWEAVSAPVSDIRKCLSIYPEGRPGYRHLEGNEGQLYQQTAGCLSTLMQFSRSFEFLAGIDGKFSIENWVKEGKGFIFLGNPKKAQETIRPILTLMVDLLGYNILDLSEDIHRRIYLLIDEFGALQKINTLVDLLTLARSKGGSCWLGAQDLGRVWETYGESTVETIFNNTGTKLTFRLDAPDTVSYLERAMGERELTEVEPSLSMGPSDHRDGLSFGRKKRTEKIIMAGEISSLEKLNCFIKVGNHNPAKIKLTFIDFPVRNESFIPRKDLVLKQHEPLGSESPLDF